MRRLAFCALALLTASLANAAVVFDEATSGDLGDDPDLAAPPVALSRGENLILGSMSADCGDVGPDYVFCDGRGDVSDIMKLSLAPDDRLRSMSVSFEFTGAPAPLVMYYGLFIEGPDLPNGFTRFALGGGAPDTFALGDVAVDRPLILFFSLNGVVEPPFGQPIDPDVAFNWRVAIDVVAAPPAPVPLPATAGLLALGLGALALRGGRRRS